MFDRTLLGNLLLTTGDAVYLFVIERDSKSVFEARLGVGLFLALLWVIWSKWLRTRRARLAALTPCFMGAFFVLFLVERGPRDLGTFIGGAGFLVGLIGLVYKLRSKAEPDEGEADRSG
jgi:hypothetical protein